MAYTNPSVSDFKTYFVRDFPFGTDSANNVLDSDVSNAFLLTNININPALFATQENYNLGYMYMAAHYMVLNLRASSQGINGQYAWLEQSKGVGGVNTSFAIPQRVLDNPYWSMFYKTNYGAQFMNIVLPQLAGQVFIVAGSTRP